MMINSPEGLTDPEDTIPYLALQCSMEGLAMVNHQRLDPSDSADRTLNLEQWNSVKKGVARVLGGLEMLFFVQRSTIDGADNRPEFDTAAEIFEIDDCIQAILSAAVEPIKFAGRHNAFGYQLERHPLAATAIDAHFNRRKAEDS